MTTLPERPTNIAREQFLAIMRERQAQPTETARETVQAWRNSILALNESKKNIAAPLKPPKQTRNVNHGQHRDYKRLPSTQGIEARAFIASQPVRPSSREVAQKFNMTEGHAAHLIKDYWGQVSWDEKMARKLVPVREYLKTLDERPCIKLMMRRFKLGKKYARQAICDQFGGGSDDVWAAGRKYLRECRQRQVAPRPRKAVAK